MIHVILWCSDTCDSNKDESDTWNALCLWNRMNHCCEITALSLAQSCTEVWSFCRSLRCPNIWQSYKSNLVASWMHLHNCRCFQEHLRMLFQRLRPRSLAPGGLGTSGITWEHRWGLPECRKGLRVASGPNYILLMLPSGWADSVFWGCRSSASKAHLTEPELAEAILGFGGIGPNILLSQYRVKWGY
jgi:hypothetical protein